jgi:hypothetical protein
LRQSFLSGALTRLIDPDTILRRKILEFVERGDFGLASGAKDGGKYARLWYAEPIGAEEVAFEPSVFLLTKAKAQELKAQEDRQSQPQPSPTPAPIPGSEPEPEPEPQPGAIPGNQRATLRLIGTVPPEVWNRLGRSVIPKLSSGEGLTVGIDLSVRVAVPFIKSMEADLRQIVDDLGLSDRVKVERSNP